MTRPRLERCPNHGTEAGTPHALEPRHDRITRHRWRPTMHRTDESAVGLAVAYADETEANDPLDLVQPERTLLLAVLTDAIQRYRRLATIQGARRRELSEAAGWILSNDREWPYSFVNVCEALGIEPSRLRHAVVEGRFAALATLGCEDPKPLLLRRQVGERRRLVRSPRRKRARRR